VGRGPGNHHPPNEISSSNEPGRAEPRRRQHHEQPRKLPTARHYDGIRRAACSVLGIGEATTSVNPTAGPPMPLHAQNHDHPLEGQDGPIPLSPSGTAIV
jgi:hypothetical protein